jgi:ABC-2 type transport system permease protein
MNVYLFELRRECRGAAIWTAVILLFHFCMITAVYPVLIDSRPAVEAALNGFPPVFKAAFGMMFGDIFSYGGFSSFVFMYISLAGGIMAASLGLSVSSREKRAGCSDFLMTKPMSRAGLFSFKLLASLMLLLISNVFYIALSTLLYIRFGDGGGIKNAVLAACALLFVELIFLAAGFFWGIFARRVRTVAGSSILLGFGGFILTALHSILDEDWLRYLAPYRYFDVFAAYSQGRFETEYVILAAVLTAGMLAAAGAKYCRGELQTV